MKLPFLWPAIGFALGILWYLSNKISFHPFLSWSFLVFLLPLLWRFRASKFFLSLLILACMILGFLYTHYRQLRPEHAIENFTDKESLSLEGIVVTDPVIKKKGKKVTISFQLESKNILIKKNKRREYFETQGKVQAFLFQPKVVPQYGDRVRMYGKLEQARPVQNPGGFDYGGYLSQQNVYCLFKAFGTKSTRILGRNQQGFFLGLVHKLRMKMESRLDRLFEPKKGAILKAISLGRRQNLDSELRDTFMKTGTSHLLAISGLHVALVCGSAYVLLLLIGFRQKMAAILTILMVFVYAQVAGAGIPVQRAGWMAAVGFFAVLCERSKQSLNTLLFIFLILLIADPGALMQLSFQLSFLSVLSLILILKYREDEWRWGEVFMRTLVVMAGTFPLVVYYFNIFSPVSILTNSLAIPLFHMSLLGTFATLAFGDIPIVGVVTIGITEWMIQSAVLWIAWLAKAPWGYRYLLTPSLSQVVIYYLSLALFYGLSTSRRQMPSAFKCFAISAWLISILSFFGTNPSSAFEMTFLSGGKNELAHLQISGKEHWLVNTGRSKPSNQARWIVEPYLKEKGINRLNAVLVTDHDWKHLGGLKTLLSNFRIGYLFSPKTEDPKRFHRIPRLPRQTNHVLLQDQDEIAVSDSSKMKMISGSKTKLSFYFRYAHWQVLWLSEVNQTILNSLKECAHEILETHTLVLPAASRIEDSFLDALMESIDPEVVVIAKETPLLRNNLENRDISLFDLDRFGAITLKYLNTHHMELESYREGFLGEWPL